jgi:Prohead core protein serine protease
MKLLTEMHDSKVLIEEGKSPGQKSYFIEGVYLQSELKNRNGRWYPHAILEREVNRYIKEMVEKNRAVGELGHPTSPTINYDRASHKILSLKEDGNNWIGRSKILSTPMGNTVKALIDDNVQVGTSSRGMGSLKESNGMNVVQDDYHLATAGDIVSDPSAPDAFVNAMMEGREWVWNNGVIVEADIAESKKVIQAAKTAELETISLKIFENFLSKL